MNGWVGGWCQEAADEVNCVNYAYDPNTPPPEDEINCAYDEAATRTTVAPASPTSAGRRS